jgi:hypothetical protein
VVASKRQRKRAEKRKRSHARGVPITPRNVDSLPRPLRLVVEGHQRLIDLVAGSEDPSAAAARVVEELADSVHRIVDLTAELDAFDVIECVKVAEMTANPETYAETEHEGMAAAIEFTALVLSARGTRRGLATPSDGRRPRPDSVVDEVRELAREALHSASMLPLLNAIASDDRSADLGLGAVLRELFVRNLTYPHILEASLRELFDDPELEKECGVVLGCSVGEIVAVMRAIANLHERNWAKRMEAFGGFVQLAHESYLKWRRSVREAENANCKIEEPSEEIRREARALFDAAWDNPADAATVEIDAVAEETGLPEHLVKVVVDHFALDLLERDPVDAATDFISGRSPLRTRPFLRDPDGSLFPAHGGLLLPAVRERVEELLKPTKAWNHYAKRRGDYLESTALRLLTEILPEATVFSSLEYFVPNPDANTTETTPAGYTKLVEADGLLLVDDVAIIVEAKGGALSPDSRTGDRVRLEQDLRKLLADAANQANRLRDRIRTDGEVRLRDGTMLNLAHVREIHAIAVTLEDLSSIATVTVSLIHAGVLAAEDVPWTVSIHDLQIIRELIDRPAEFLLYLRRRTEPTVTLRYHAVDELDLFLEFFATGLYVEPDPEKVREALPHLGEPSVAERRRYSEQGFGLLTSRTDQLDAWYFHTLGMRTTPAPKPCHRANAEVQGLVDELRRRGDAGWLSVGATLLAGSSALQERVARSPRRLARLTRDDGRGHSYTMFIGGKGPDSALVVLATLGVDETMASEQDRLTSYLRAKKHQTLASMAVCFVFDAENSECLLGFIYLAGADTDPELDRLVEGLFPLTRRTDRLPRRSR